MLGVGSPAPCPALVRAPLAGVAWAVAKRCGGMQPKRLPANLVPPLRLWTAWDWARGGGGGSEPRAVPRLWDGLGETSAGSRDEPQAVSKLGDGHGNVSPLKTPHKNLQFNFNNFY